MAADRIVVFTDGAAKGNPGPGGWGAIIATPDGRVTELGGGAAHTTNNQMELTGAIEALRHLQHTPGPVDVYTDSTYVIRGISEWIWAWRRRGWKTAEGGDVLNRDYWEALARLVAARDKADAVAWHYVRGHTDIPGNERADTIAVVFSNGRRADLYHGPIGAYGIPLYDIPADTRLPTRLAGGAARGKPPPAYSYLSVVDGRPMRHTTWADCERRVKGRSGARFKKSKSAEDEAAILASWGFSPGDVAR